ncbi:glycosyltransferase family 9 protein [Oryzomonas japonica]|uniref:Glycosyltransferase family 9 protein n=1 Tax=Oryzomonas japonica TaxID=2603858 RepID=A0A7J4ZPV2_9BACT|nr:glycosyltransferase family 9 protein [Oryzomonas japonica]KAB0664868.1 glycosyltransferase family 9 protein [Oryzomonas japonica]
MQLLKGLDSCIGRIAVWGAALIPQRLPVGPPCSFLLIRPGGIGDAVHLIPAISAIKSAYPDAGIDILAEKRNSAIFILSPYIRHVFHYDRPAELFRALCTAYDVVIDTEQWHRLSAVVARMTRTPVLIGYATNERARLFTHPAPYSQGEYEIDSFFRLLVPLGIEPHEVVFPFLDVPGEAVEQGDALLGEIKGKAYVIIFPGASIPERQWGAERFRKVAEMLTAFGIAVVVVGGREDERQGEIIVAGGAGLNLAGRTSLSETAAVIQKSVLLVSGDSGVLHIAVGLGVPTVSLFGPGRAKKWAPRGEHHLVIDKVLTCSPCTTFGTTPPCPIAARCMRDITVDEVCNAVTVLLTATGGLPSSCYRNKEGEERRS